MKKLILICSLIPLFVNAQTLGESIYIEPIIVTPSVRPKIESGSTILEKIALCESSNNPLAKNPLSSAKGRFQFLDSTWEYYGKKLWGDDWINKNVLDWNDNTELANYAFELNGTVDWLESAYCWNV